LAESRERAVIRLRTREFRMTKQSDEQRVESLGYTPELSRVLGLFDNFSVAFSYLSPMVGIYSLFALGVGTGGPRYLWLMLLVAMVFGELGSHYPLAGALYQYGKYSVGPGYGWWVGWIYGIALLVTVASVDTGVVGYFAAFINNIFGTHMDGNKHSTILYVTVGLILIQTFLNIVGAKVMGQIARLGVYVESIGTFGVAIALAIHGFHHGFSFLFTTQGAENAKTNLFGVNFGGHWLTGAALVAILAHSYIFYGFESAGDIAEETKDASRQVPRAMRSSLLYGGLASFVLVAGLIMATPADSKGYGNAVMGGAPAILAQLPQWSQDFFLVMVIVAFFSCGTSVQGAGARLAFSYARDRQIPGAKIVRKVSPRFHTPSNAIMLGAAIPILATLLVNVNPANDVHILWFTYPKGINALFALVSFGVSGIYLSFFLTVLGSIIAKSRGWAPGGEFKLGRSSSLVSWGALVYLGVMLVNVLWPSGLTSGRALVNYDWITFVVMLGIVLLGGIYFVISRPDKRANIKS
jgi:amino acid transporter